MYDECFLPQGRMVSLPRVKSWRIVDGFDAILMFDFSNARRLDYTCDETTHPFDLVLLPSNLSEMILAFNFTPEILSMPQPHSMPHINTMEFCFMDLPSHLQRYFHLPKLKRLILKDVTCRSSFDTIHTKEEPPIFLDPLFFQSVPDLEFLSLFKTPVDDKLLANLRYCPQFRELRIDTCHVVERLFSSLPMLLADEGPLPSLKIVHVDTSWPYGSDFSFGEFISLCIRHRPGMVISGNEKEYDPSAHQ
jgi:hypothetical protein